MSTTIDPLSFALLTTCWLFPNPNHLHKVLYRFRAGLTSDARIVRYHCVSVFQTVYVAAFSQTRQNEIQLKLFKTNAFNRDRDNIALILTPRLSV